MPNSRRVLIVGSVAGLILALSTFARLDASGIVQQAYNLVQNAGSSLPRRTTLNCDGSTVICTDSGGKTVLSSSGGGGGAPSGPAGGDLSGTYPNPGVAQVNGVAYPASPSTSGLPIITAANTATYKVLPNCPAGGLGYTAGTFTFGCNTIPAAQQRSITFVLDGGGSALTTAALASFPTAAYSCTINRTDISADQSGSITVDIWKKAGAIPSAADKISASAPVTLSSAQLNQNGSISGWTTSVASGDVFGGTIASVATVQRVTIQIWCQ